MIIEKAQAKQRSDSARGRREGQITVGDRVWLSNKNMKLDTVGRARKLEPLYMGPLKVLEVRGNAATLELPPDCRLAPTFNFDLLKPFVDGQRSHPDRPVQEARPGPVPEEDPERQGPAANPVYEVEAVIGKRRRGHTWQYRVKWLGWPLEQSSWMPREELTDCANLVRDFEAARVEQRDRQQRVAALHTQHAVQQALGAVSWADEIQSGAQRQPEEEKYPDPPSAPAVAVESAEEQKRREFRAAAELTLPVAADRPPVGKHHQIDMGSQRCVAATKGGGHCKAKTRHGEYCWVHLAQLRGARIKASQLPGAGKGLYAARDFHRDEVVARYTGDLVPTASPDNFGSSAYVLELSEAVSIDAARTNAAEGRMINDARGSGRRSNSRFSCNQRNKTAVVRATRAIKKGEEIFVAYGREYWPTAKVGTTTGAQQPARAAQQQQQQQQQGSKDDPIQINSMAAVAKDSKPQGGTV